MLDRAGPTRAPKSPWKESRRGPPRTAGLFVVGFDRDAPGSPPSVAVYRGGAWREQGFAIAPVAYDIQKIDGPAATDGHRHRSGHHRARKSR